MKLMTIVSLFVLLANLAYAAELPTCKDRRGDQLSGSSDELRKIMNSRANRPQVLVNGVVEKILQEDKNGRPHQKFILNMNGTKLQIVSNLEFGRIPVAIGTQIQVCGEFLNVGTGMVHWTHFDPHGGHPDGFSIVNNKLYGDVETPL